MTTIKDLRSIHLPNLVIFGVIPTLILYMFSRDFSDFIGKVDCFRTADSLFIYFALLYFVAALFCWSGILVRIISPQWKLFVQATFTTLRSIYYVISGICLTAGVILLTKISNLAEAGIVLFSLVTGAAFFLIAVSLVRFLPPTLRPDG